MRAYILEEADSDRGFMASKENGRRIVFVARGGLFDATDRLIKQRPEFARGWVARHAGFTAQDAKLSLGIHSIVMRELAADELR